MANLTKDQRIIKNNPGKSAYELKELGISDKAFAELLAQEGEKPQEPKKEEPAKQEPKPATVEPAKEPEPKQAPQSAAVKTIIPARATPAVKAAQPPHVAQGQGILVEKKSGKRTPMSRAMAIRWSTKHPGKYEVI